MTAASPSPSEPTATAQKQTFPKSARLRTKAEFERVYARRCRASDGTLLIFAETNASGVTRLGLSVSRKVGGAVVRNRIRRLLREAFRQCRHDLPVGLDLIVIPSSPDRASLVVYRDSLVRLTQKLARRLSDEASKGRGP
jgi:ribonuclease P protein component